MNHHCLTNQHCFRMFKKLLHKISVIIRWISIWVTRITRFLTHDIFFLKEEDFSRWKRRGVRDAKTIILMLNTFTAQKIGYQVTALAYRSMMSVVPAIAIAFYLTSGVGLKDMFQEILVKKAGFISPFKSCTVVADDPFAQTISDYTAAGKTSAWHWLKNKSGLDQNALGQLYTDYALGVIPDADGFTQAIMSKVSEYYAN